MTQLKTFAALLLCAAAPAASFAQPIPSQDENIPYLVTFGKNADKKWGDDDFVQVFFFAVPDSRKDPVYIRVYDPDVGGKVDEDRSGFNTKTKFTIYGGKGCHSDPDARKTSPEGNFKSGVMLATKTYGADAKVDGQWITFGPFNPVEGELQPEFGGYVFKMVVEGQEGDDGNLYKVFLSGKSEQNINIEGGNGFTYEYSFRTNENAGTLCHLYPFVGKNVISVKVNTFDYDKEGMIRIISVSKNGELAEVSDDGNWSVSTHKVTEAEINTSLDVQMVKKNAVKNNNIVMYITNQYGVAMPFFTVPIGGAPKFKSSIKVKPMNKTD